MRVLKMKTLEDSPSIDYIPVWTANADERRMAMEKLSLKIVDEFVNFTFHKPESELVNNGNCD